jgi:MerR family transcriptional regulator, thiopeptide resistance regulator
MAHHAVKQLAAVSGISVRTPQHFHHIGLLRPACIGASGYRYYGPEELHRLILLHRELGMLLQDFARLLDTPGFDRIAALRGQRQLLAERLQRCQTLLATIDLTLTHLQEHSAMTDTDLCEGLSPAKQAEYEQWLIQRKGSAMRARIHHSKRQLSKLSPTERAGRQQQLADIEAALADCCRQRLGFDAPAVTAELARHRNCVASRWDRPFRPQAYAALADLYLAHPDFRARYEGLQAGLTDYLAGAMKACAART